MYKKKVHYLCCDNCGWRLQMTPNTLFYNVGDYCKDCGKELENYDFLYRQAATYPREYYQ